MTSGSKIGSAAGGAWRAAGLRNSGQEVVAGHVWKAAIVDGVGEARRARLEAFVAACGDGDRIADCDGLTHGLPEFDFDQAAAICVTFDLHGAPGIGASGEGENSAREPAADVVGDAIDGEAAGAEDREDGS